jgi:hypothetical protein
MKFNARYFASYHDQRGNKLSTDIEYVYLRARAYATTHSASMDVATVGWRRACQAIGAPHPTGKQVKRLVSRSPNRHH